MLVHEPQPYVEAQDAPPHVASRKAGGAAGRSGATRWARRTAACLGLAGVLFATGAGGAAAAEPGLGRVVDGVVQGAGQAVEAAGAPVSAPAAPPPQVTEAAGRADAAPAPSDPTPTPGSAPRGSAVAPGPGVPVGGPEGARTAAATTLVAADAAPGRGLAPPLVLAPSRVPEVAAAARGRVPAPRVLAPSPSQAPSSRAATAPAMARPPTLDHRGVVSAVAASAAGAAAAAAAGGVAAALLGLLLLAAPALMRTLPEAVVVLRPPPLRLALERPG
jgi:hypothetical protein